MRLSVSTARSGSHRLPPSPSLGGVICQAASCRASGERGGRGTLQLDPSVILDRHRTADGLFYFFPSRQHLRVSSCPSRRGANPKRGNLLTTQSGLQQVAKRGQVCWSNSTCFLGLVTAPFVLLALPPRPPATLLLVLQQLPPGALTQPTIGHSSQPRAALLSPRQSYAAGSPLHVNPAGH